MATFQTLTTTRYFPPGVYIGQLIQPSPGNPNVQRIPCYIGRGSRYAYARDLQIRRAFVFSEKINFPAIPPYEAPLEHNASNQKAVSRLVRDDGVVVKTNQWDFVFDPAAQKYNKIIINPEAFSSVNTYKLDYQSVDRDVLDPLPVEDIRDIAALGSTPSAPDFSEYRDFFLSYTISTPTGASTNTNNEGSRDAVTVRTAGGANLGTVGFNAAFDVANVMYNRFYQLRCVAVGTTTDGYLFAEFAWQSNPMSAGNDNLPPMPLTAENDVIPTAVTLKSASDPTADLVYPRFVVVATTSGVSAKGTATLESGIVLDFNFGVTGFNVEDLFTFNVYGPALFEVDARVNSNINQIHQSGPVTGELTNTSTVAVDFADSNNPANTYNLLYKLECLSAPTGAHATTTHTQAGNTLTFKYKISGLVGNGKSVVLQAGAAFAVSYASNTLTVTCVAAVTTFADVITGVGALSSSDISVSLTAGSSATVVVPAAVAVLGGGVDNTFTFMWSEYGNNINVSGVSGTLTQTTTATTNPAPTLAIGTSGVVVQFDCIFDNFKAATQATFAYVNGADTLTFAARTPGSAGNVISVEINAPSGATTVWASVGNKISITPAVGTTTTQLQTFLNTIAACPIVAYGVGGATAVGAMAEEFLTNGQDADTYMFPILAPRQFYQAKDSRNISLEVSVANNSNGPGAGTVSGSYVSDTPEGGFGTFSVTANALSPSSPGYSNGAFALNSNVLMFARNMFGGPTSASGGNKHTVADKTTFAVQMGSLDAYGVRHSTIDWSLVEYAYETIGNSLSTNNYPQSDVLTDVTGLITGVPATPYAILQHVPDTILSVKDELTGTSLSYSIILNTSGEYTQYIAFPTKPSGNVTVHYKYRGIEPDPGEFYFLTGKYIRPDEFYNTPILITSLDDGRKLLDPPEVLNHLSIMNEIVMGDIGAPAMYVVQVKDPDHDGNYTDVDFKNAIKASESPTNITDLVVLSHFSSLNDQLASVTSMSDPFKQRFRLAWVGAPIGKPIGNENTPDSLVYLAQRTLQTHGTSPAHGTRILVAPTLATRDIQIDNSTTVEVSLDGSFVAGALAGLVASFTDPGADILRKQLPGFKSIQTYGERGSPENLILGGSNIVFFTNQGNGVYIMEENVTVDNFASDFLLINNMTQKMAVTRYVRDELDSKAIGLVVSTPAAGVGLITGFLINALATLVSRGVIAPYQTADGRERSIDPGSDVQVQRDSLDPTRYSILYSYYLRNTIKRITGLYAVNTNNFGTGA